jgi:N-acetylneuraminate lyase
MEDYRQCRALAKDGREIFFGRDEKLLEGLKLGATSAVGSTYNFAARLSLETAALFAAGQLEAAADNQAYCTKAIDIMLAHGGLPGIRAALAFAGIDCGPMRLPLQAVPDSVAKAMKKELDAIGYFERI